MSEVITEEQFGVRYASGLEDWNTTSWFGLIATPEQREVFAEQYRLRMAGFGVPDASVVFMRRTVTTEYSDAEVIVDPEPLPEVDPEPLPEDTPPL